MPASNTDVPAPIPDVRASNPESVIGFHFFEGGSLYDFILFIYCFYMILYYVHIGSFCFHMISYGFICFYPVVLYNLYCFSYDLLSFHMIFIKTNIRIIILIIIITIILLEVGPHFPNVLFYYY